MTDSSLTKDLCGSYRLLLLYFSIGLPGSIHAQRLDWDANQLYTTCVTDQLQWSSTEKSITLQRGMLIEDDGPAAGYSYHPNVERLTPKVRIKKELLIDNPSASKATLLVARGGALQCTVNGQPIKLGPAQKCGNYWQQYIIPPKVLQKGKNEIVLWGTGQIWIARDDERAMGSRNPGPPPNRSAKSGDGGKTWSDTQLGSKDNLDGEYYVRLFLDQYRTKGVLTSPVIDVGNLSQQPIAPPIKAVGPIRIDVNGNTGKHGRIDIRTRSGSTPIPDKKHWSNWQSSTKPQGRFLQFEVTLSTKNASYSPTLKGITIQAEIQLDAKWTKNIQIIKYDNPRIVRSSIPFEDESFTHPKLKQFRKQFRLDSLTDGAKNEFELITRLAKWSSEQWKKGHLGEAYPLWNALEILKQHRDGNPVGGFCLQYNLVLLQACESFGIAGRVLSLGPGNRTDLIRSGHEVIELWSNDYRKWVYVDGNHALYVVDEKTKTPLSLLELHQRQSVALTNREHRPVKIVHVGAGESPWTDFTNKIPFIELRLIPRSNFLEQKSPLPLNQGMRGWFWTGHYVWAGERNSARRLYPHRVQKRDNWEWTLNQAHVWLGATKEPGVLRVHLETQTPSFESFIAQIDNEKSQRISSGWLWKLRKGKNRLRVYPRNVAGREGIPTDIALKSLIPTRNER